MENKSKALEYLNIARSTFYYQSLLEEKDEGLRVKIEKVLADNPSYGHKRIAAELKLNRKHIKRVMKKFGIKPRRGRKKPWKQGKNGELLIYTADSRRSYWLTIGAICRGRTSHH